MVETVGALILGAELAGFTLFSIGATTVTLGTVVGAGAIIGANLALSYALAPRPGAVPGLGSSALPDPEAGHQAFKQAIPPRIVGYGRNRIAGAYVLYEAQNGVSYDIMALHHGRIAAIVGYYLHDDVVTIDTSGYVQEQGDGRYGTNIITIKTRLGLATETPYSEITSAIAEWTHAHRGDGIASLMLRCDAVSLATYYTKYPRGKPEPSVVADCTPIYDPRDAGQSRTDPFTWTASSNPVLQIIDLLTDADRGMGFDWDTLIEPVIDDLMIEANACDELVPLASGGFEKRYTSNGTFPLDADDADKLGAILDTCDGWVGQNADGTLALKVGKYQAPADTDTIETRHIRGFSLQFGVADEEVVNELVPDYTEPAVDYKTAPAQPWRDEVDISERGKVRSQRLALPWVQSHAQARRLAKRRMAQTNARLRGTLTTTLYGLKFLGERWVRIDAPDLSEDLTAVVAEIRSATIDLMSATITFRFTVIDPNAIDAWEAIDEEGKAPEIPAKLGAEPPPIPVITRIVAPAPGGQGAVIYVADPGRPDLQFQVRYRVSGSGGDFSLSAQQDATIYSGLWSVRPQNNSAQSGYEFQVRSFSPSGAGSDWSTARVSPYN